MPSEVEGIDIGKLILSPTRTYAPVANRIFEHHRKNIHGMVHCSGGGQTKILHFIDNLHVIKNNMLAVPPLFRLIQSESGTSWKEMYTVFNMGHRLEYYVPENLAPSIIEIASSYNIDAQVIGHIEPSPIKKLTIISEFGEFEYDS
jgi:phosphoribosylformylglycinamidine cyclo-ligase